MLVMSSLPVIALEINDCRLEPWVAGWLLRALHVARLREANALPNQSAPTVLNRPRLAQSCGAWRHGGLWRAREPLAQLHVCMQHDAHACSSNSSALLLERQQQQSGEQAPSRATKEHVMAAPAATAAPALPVATWRARGETAAACLAAGGAPGRCGFKRACPSRLVPLPAPMPAAAVLLCALRSKRARRRSPTPATAGYLCPTAAWRPAQRSLCATWATRSRARRS